MYIATVYMNVRGQLVRIGFIFLTNMSKNQNRSPVTMENPLSPYPLSVAHPSLHPSIHSQHTSYYTSILLVSLIEKNIILPMRNTGLFTLFCYAVSSYFSINCLLLYLEWVNPIISDIMNGVRVHKAPAKF